MCGTGPLAADFFLAKSLGTVTKFLARARFARIAGCVARCLNIFAARSGAFRPTISDTMRSIDVIAACIDCALSGWALTPFAFARFCVTMNNASASSACCSVLSPRSRSAVVRVSTVGSSGRWPIRRTTHATKRKRAGPVTVPIATKKSAYGRQNSGRKCTSHGQTCSADCGSVIASPRAWKLPHSQRQAIPALKCMTHIQFGWAVEPLGV